MEEWRQFAFARKHAWTSEILVGELPTRVSLVRSEVVSKPNWGATAGLSSGASLAENTARQASSGTRYTFLLIDDADVYVLINPTGGGSMAVNAFQRDVDVVIQKYLGEGFGLVVSGPPWKNKTAVAGAAGGIPMQFPENHRQNVVASVDQRAEKVLPLLDHPQQASDFGRAGAELVRKHLLPPRLIRDKLQLLWVLLHA